MSILEKRAQNATLRRYLSFLLTVVLQLACWMPALLCNLPPGLSRIAPDSPPFSRQFRIGLRVDTMAELSRTGISLEQDLLAGFDKLIARRGVELGKLVLTNSGAVLKHSH